MRGIIAPPLVCATHDAPLEFQLLCTFLKQSLLQAMAARFLRWRNIFCCMAIATVLATSVHFRYAGAGIRELLVTNVTSHIEFVRPRRVAVIIPFRDREAHLAAFKTHWHQFSAEAKHISWVVVVAEQFESEPWNRGFSFNAGLVAVVTNFSNNISAYQNLADERSGFDCIVSHDIDYVPDPGVDYASCEVPTQLSSEIDRYRWMSPSINNTGGVISMKLKHWRKINGFSNNFRGWGGEDDELFHRIRLSELLQLGFSSALGNIGGAITSLFLAKGV